MEEVRVWLDSESGILVFEKTKFVIVRIIMSFNEWSGFNFFGQTKSVPVWLDLSLPWQLQLQVQRKM